MALEDKNLLLKDLCSRLPHSVIAHASEINKNGIITDVNIPYNMVNLTVDNNSGKYELVPLFDIKPYLRPMSSMTEEERKEYESFFSIGEYACGGSFYGVEYEYIADDYNDVTQSVSLIDWLLKHHFDFRGLIKKSLAIVAPEGMYKFE